jgi:hypothetical protein
MAQTTDFIIDNDTGAAVRKDINDALMALATTNTGLTAPVNPVFGMLWVDTTNACLKIYAGGDVWLIIIDSVVATTTSGAGSSFPSGTQMVFHQVAVPPGWAQAVYNDYALRVVGGVAGGVAGNTGFSSWTENPMSMWSQTSVAGGVLTPNTSGNDDMVLATAAFPWELKYVDVMICTKS